MFICKHLLSKYALVLVIPVVIALATGSYVLAQSTYKVKTAVISSAGSPASGAGVRINSTLGQPSPIGIGTGTGTALYGGFWKSGWLAIITDSDLPDAVRNELFQNYPNPFNPTTTIKYSISQASSVRLVVYNVAGQRIRTLVNETKPAGTYSEIWDGKNDGGRSVATGIYFYRFIAGNYSEVKKMILLR